MVELTVNGLTIRTHIEDYKSRSWNTRILFTSTRACETLSGHNIVPYRPENDGIGIDEYDEGSVSDRHRNAAGRAGHEIPEPASSCRPEVPPVNSAPPGTATTLYVVVTLAVVWPKGRRNGGFPPFPSWVRRRFRSRDSAS